jgi:hypothetical protein
MCVIVLGYLGFQVSSFSIIVEQMLMVIVGIMIFQPLLLLVRGDAGASERFVEPKILEWLRPGVVSWRGSRDVLLLECGRPNC